MLFIHQLKDWPCFKWDSTKVDAKLAEVSFELGRFSGRLGAIGFEIQKEAVCETLATEILNSSEIVLYTSASERSKQFFITG